MTAAPPTGTPQPSPAPGGLTSRGLIALIAGGGGVVTLITAAIFAGMLPPVLQGPPEVNAANEQEQGRELEGVDALYYELNLAMQEQDREEFMSHISGDAVEPLNLWWDNMEKIGWTTGAIDFAGSFPEEPTVETPAEVQTVFGAAMGFSAFSPRGSGTDDAGLSFIQGFPYTATVSVGETLTISGWEPSYTPTPWETGELYVAKSEHVVLAGPIAEQALVDASLAAAEASAVWVLDDFAAAGREVPLTGFTAFITADDPLFSSWFSSDETDDWRMDPAGFAQPTLRPSGTSSGVDPLIATGNNTSTGVVAMGPGSLDDLERIFAHEFVHVVHYTEIPGGFGVPPLATIEGWARYQDKRLVNGGSFPTSNRTISSCVDQVMDPSGTVPSDEQLRGENAGCYYEIAALRYAYAAANGYDVYRLAALAKVTGLDVISVSSDLQQDPVLSDGDFAAWVTANY